MGSLKPALFLDIPSLIDSAWRRLEYLLNAECDYRPGPPPNQPGPPAAIAPRAFWTKPPFWFFALTVFFVSYGPTWGGLCAIAPRVTIVALRNVFALVIICGSLVLGAILLRQAHLLIQRRFNRLAHEYPHQISRGRPWIVYAIAVSGIVLCTAIGVSAGTYLLGPQSSDHVCAVQNGSLIAVLRFLMCFGAVAAFGLIARKRTSLNIVYAQVAILIVVAAIQWYLLATPSAREASDLPYRHVFLFWAPCVIAVLLFAPTIARRTFAGVPAAESNSFREWLHSTELFVNRNDPELSYQRLGYAVVYGPAYHPLHLLLMPAMVALVAPVKWLYPSVFGALFLSALLLVWGNVSSRWDQLNVYIERWFLRGTSLLISLLVVLIAALRVAQFDYVSTILDAAPFGVVFGLIVMTYVLFWLLEYWMNRVAAGELLRILGANENQACVPYVLTLAQNADDPIRVRRNGRYLVTHGAGRFVVVGTIGDLDPPAAEQPPDAEAAPRAPEAAFQTYSFTEIFSRLGDRASNLADREYVSDINQRVGNYFFWLNLLALLVTGGFAAFSIAQHYANNGINPVVTAQAPPAPERLIDLTKLLRQEEGPARPAIVVVGSGGGTRAALYTASVLNGLHRLAVDSDIVLVSGVSGGGVALAYFAANSDLLTARSTVIGLGHCPESKTAKRTVEDEWDCFNKAVTAPFIEDVLNGATEWRVFANTPLSELLAESFETRLFKPDSTLGSISTPALILNSTVVSHPDDESDALKRTIDQAQTCDEAERTFKLMSGGRLIFTNLRDIGAFPQREVPIPDVRLPYEIIQDTDIHLASAATLNANFPPVFPTARIRVRNQGPNTCAYRSYYVTDGGAQENLGLISALYALKSALSKIPNGAHVRPLHLVIAEASAVTYDYSQDRGFGALFGGSSERLAGGVTNLVLEDVKQELQRLQGPKATIYFHYLDLPLAFRARGGFGTHWMYAKEYHLNDPRPRTTPWLNFLPFAAFTERKAAINRQQLEELWLALHDPDLPFCDRNDQNAFKGAAAKVQKWVCGSPVSDPKGSSDPNRRDLHIDSWQQLVDQMRPYRKR